MKYPSYLDGRFRGRYSMVRGWMDDPLFQGEAYTRAQAYEWLVGNAVYKTGKVRTPEGPVHLERGQLSYSLRYLAKTWGWSKDKVRSFLQEMHREGYIHLVSKGNRKTVQNLITICAYDEIQPRHDSFAPEQKTGHRHLNDNETTNKKKENKDKNIYNSDEWKESLRHEIGDHAYQVGFEGAAYNNGVLTVRTDRQHAYIKRHCQDAILSVFGDVRVESLTR